MELVFGNDGIELVRENGNWNLKRDIGFSPVQALVASVAACGMYVFDGILSKSGIEHEFSNTTVSYEVDEMVRVKPVRLITIVYRMRVQESDKQRVERIVHLVSKSCPVMASLNPSIIVKEEVEYVQKMGKVKMLV